MMVALREAEETELLHVKQEQVLKSTIRELERAQKRDGANLEYLKNVIYKYIVLDEHQVDETVFIILTV